VFTDDSSFATVGIDRTTDPQVLQEKAPGGVDEQLEPRAPLQLLGIGSIT
jgi:hypothetical protein